MTDSDNPNDFDRDQFDYNNDQESTSGLRPTVFVGTVEANAFKTKKENENKINRIVEVRKQEKELSRQNLDKMKRTQQDLSSNAEQNEKLQEYSNKLAKLRELQKLKEISEYEMGKAHRDAEMQQRLQEENNQRKKLENENEKKVVAERSEKAAGYLKIVEEQRNGEMKRLLETRRQVLDEATKTAHNIAAEYRELQKNIKPEEQELTSYQIWDKNMSKKTFFTKNNMVDYSSTHMHNPVIVSHKNEEPTASAFETAEREMQKTMKKTQDLVSLKDDFRKKSVERGAKALDQISSKKFMEQFNKELDQLQKAQNEEKIREGMRNPSAERKPATVLNRRENKDLKAEKAFEDMFLEPEPKQPKKSSTFNDHDELEDSKCIVKDFTKTKPGSTASTRGKSVRSQTLKEEPEPRGRSQERPVSSQAKKKTLPAKQAPKSLQSQEDFQPGSESATVRTKQGSTTPHSRETEIKTTERDKSPSNKESQSPLTQSKGPESTNRNNESIKSFPPQMVSNDSNPNFLRTNPYFPTQFSQSGAQAGFPQGQIPFGMDPQQAAQFANSGYAQNFMQPFMGMQYPGFQGSNGLAAPVNFQQGYPYQQFPYWQMQPGMSMQQSGVGLQQSGVGLQQSGVGLQQSGIGMQQSGGGMQQPVTGMQMQGSGVYQPENSGATGQFPHRTENSLGISSHSGSGTNSLMSSEFKEGDQAGFKQSGQANQRMTPQFQHAQFQNSLRNQALSPTQEQVDLDSFGIRNYIQEQEEYLKKLDVERKRLQDRSKGSSSSDLNRVSDKSGGVSEKSGGSGNGASLRELYENRREEARKGEVKGEVKGDSAYPSTNHSTRDRKSELERKSEFERKSDFDGNNVRKSEFEGNANNGRKSNEVAAKKNNGWTKNLEREEEEEEEGGEEEEEERKSTISLEDNEAKLAELKKKTDELLEKFMKPKINVVDDSDEEESKVREKYEDDENLLSESSEESSAMKYRPRGMFEPSNFINPNLVKEQPKMKYEREEYDNVGDTPEKITHKKRDLHATSPSELDYSVSDKDRSDKKSYVDRSLELNQSKNNSMLMKDQSIAGEPVKTFMEFSFKNQPFTSSLNNEKNNFDRNKESGYSKGSGFTGSFKESKDNKENTNSSNKGWKMDFNVSNKENEDDNRFNKKQNIQEEQDEDEDNAQEEEEGASGNTKGLSLAELFLRNKKNIVNKHEAQKAVTVKEDKDNNKGKRTKEEILKQRKEMMEYRGPALKKKNEDDEHTPKDSESNRRLDKKSSNDDFGFKSKSKEPKPDLLDRLALGKKTKVDQKEMKALTQKNYEQLPEIKKRREEEKKKDDFKKRQELVKKLDQKVRSNLVKTSLK